MSNATSNNNETILLQTFSDPTHSWSTLNDPVMGGLSYSSISIENDMAIFDGAVLDVPSLQAPGFITMRGNGDYPDVSSCEFMVLRARSTDEYEGYRISFGNRYVPGNRFARGYKADFDSPVGSDMQDIVIPFDMFTVRWSDLTGDAIVTCAENPDFCPDMRTLQNMKTISIWGEGVAGKLHLEIESISATGCSADNMVFSTISPGSSRSFSASSSPFPMTLVVLLFAIFRNF